MECKDLLTETVHIIPVVFAVVTDVVYGFENVKLIKNVVVEEKNT